MMRVIVLVAIIGVGSVVVHGQGQPQTMTWTAAEQLPAGGPARTIGSAEIGVISLDPLNVGGVVVDAPYSAEAITEITQTLADGNRIEQRTSATIARDGKGRIRREQQGIALGAFVAASDQPIVTITDPTTGVHITLNYEQKVAYRAKPTFQVFDTAPGDGRIAAGGRMTVMTSRGAAIEAGGAAAGQSTFTIATPPIDELIIDSRPFELPVPPPPPPAPPMAGAARFDGQVVKETLAPREIEGIHAEGTRTTMTIPAGAMGNVLPIEVVAERWYSPELQVVLMTKRSDPRFGETVYRLTNIDRSEPSDDLFRVPAGFKVEDMRPGVRTPLKPEDQ